MAATIEDSAKAVKALLDARADTSIPDRHGYSLFQTAGVKGSALVALILKDHGLDPFEQNKDGLTALHRACWGMQDRHKDTVRVLLNMGFDPSLKARNKMDCLQMTH